MEGKIKLDIFGFEVGINPLGYIVKATKFNDELVTITIEWQSGKLYQKQIDTLREYQITPDEFLSEFQKQNAVATMNFQ
jgi:hypothetical protein